GEPAAGSPPFWMPEIGDQRSEISNDRGAAPSPAFHKRQGVWYLNSDIRSLALPPPAHPFCRSIWAFCRKGRRSRGGPAFGASCDAPVARWLQSSHRGLVAQLVRARA